MWGEAAGGLSGEVTLELLSVRMGRRKGHEDMCLGTAGSVPAGKIPVCLILKEQ